MDADYRQYSKLRRSSEPDGNGCLRVAIILSILFIGGELSAIYTVLAGFDPVEPEYLPMILIIDGIMIAVASFVMAVVVVRLRRKTRLPKN